MIYWNLLYKEKTQTHFFLIVLVSVPISETDATFWINNCWKKYPHLSNFQPLSFVRFIKIFGILKGESVFKSNTGPTYPPSPQYLPGPRYAIPNFGLFILGLGVFLFVCTFLGKLQHDPYRLKLKYNSLFIANPRELQNIFITTKAIRTYIFIWLTSRLLDFS